MTSLEKITDSLLHSKAIQTTNHEHLQSQIQLRETNRNSALMNLKLLVGDVQRRVRDMEDVGERVKHLDDQLHQNKLKLSAVLLLLLKEQKRFDALHHTILHSESSWEGFPHQLAVVLKALHERLTLIQELKKFRFFLLQAQRSFIVMWHIERLKTFTEEEVSVQKKELSSFLCLLDEKIHTTKEEKSEIEKNIQIVMKEKESLLTKLHLSQKRELVLEAEWKAIDDIERMEDQEREAIVLSSVSAGNSLFDGLQERKEKVLSSLAVLRSNLQDIQDEKCSIKKENAAALLQHATDLKRSLVRQEELVRERVFFRKMAYQSLQHCVSIREKTIASLQSMYFVISIADIVRQHYVFRQSGLIAQQVEKCSLQKTCKKLHAQREALLLAQRVEGARKRRYAEGSAAVFAEESLLRQSVEDEAFQERMQIKEKEEMAKPRDPTPPRPMEVIHPVRPQKPKGKPHELSNESSFFVLKESASENPCTGNSKVHLYPKAEQELPHSCGSREDCRPPRSSRDSSGAYYSNSVVFSSHCDKGLQNKEVNSPKDQDNPNEKGSLPSSMLLLPKPSSPAVPGTGKTPVHGISANDLPVPCTASQLWSDPDQQQLSRKSRFFQQPLPRPVPPSTSPTFAPLCANSHSKRKKGGRILNALAEKSRRKNTKLRHVPVPLGEQESPQPRRPQGFIKVDNRAAVVTGPGISEISALTFALRQQRQVNGGGKVHTPPRGLGNGSLVTGAPSGGTSFPLESLKKGDDLFADLF